MPKEIVKEEKQMPHAHVRDKRNVEGIETTQLSGGPELSLPWLGAYHDTTGNGGARINKGGPRDGVWISKISDYYCF